jgi:hypothetical protein
MDAWEVQMDFEIGGGGSRGADGMAFWYVAEPKKEGISMGSAEEYRGMAIYFDTFDNDGQVQLCARLATHHRTHHESATWPVMNLPIFAPCCH